MYFSKYVNLTIKNVKKQINTYSGLQKGYKA